MQLYPIVMVAVLFLVDGAGSSGQDAASRGGLGAFVAIGGMVSIGLWAQGMMWLWRWRLKMGRPRAILASDRTVRLARLLMLVNHAVAVLMLGWLDDVRSMTGDLVLVDEMIALFPVVAGFAWTWWIMYPIDRRVQEATLIGRLDRGQPVYALPSCWRFTLGQLQLNVFLLLVPLLLIQTIAETLDMVAARWTTGSMAMWLAEGGAFVGAAVVFVFAPLLARVCLNVKPMPASPMREMLVSVCERHGVQVREVLVWHTHGTMINAAVMGLFGRLRYVLMTEALLEMLTIEQIEGVMAHEIGHAKRRHMPWMVAVLMGSIGLALLVVEGLLMLAMRAGWGPEVYGDAVSYALIGGQLGLALLMFGWASRRFERQADAFAAQHLSGMGRFRGRGSDEQLVITPHAAMTMSGALQAIADLNHVDPARKSWRHGSIRWRQEYLADLIDRPIVGLGIDRLVGWMKVASAVVVIVLVMVVIMQINGDAAAGDAARAAVHDPAEGMR